MATYLVRLRKVIDVEEEVTASDANEAVGTALTTLDGMNLAETIEPLQVYEETPWRITDIERVPDPDEVLFNA